MRHSEFIRALTYKSQSAWNVNIVISLTVIFMCMFKNLICMFIGQFGSLVWSASEKCLLYVAEKKLPKAVSYFEKQKGKVYMQLFWEKLTGKRTKVHARPRAPVMNFIIYLFFRMGNGLFESCMLGCQALKQEWGYGDLVMIQTLLLFKCSVNYFVTMLTRYWSFSRRGYLLPHFKSKAWQLSTQYSNCIILCWCILIQ